MEKRYTFKINTSDGNCHVFKAMFEGGLQAAVDKIAPNGSFVTFTIVDVNGVVHMFFYDRVVNIDICEAKVKE